MLLWLLSSSSLLLDSSHQHGSSRCCGIIVVVQGSSSSTDAVPYKNTKMMATSLDQSFLDNVDLRQLDRYGESVALRHATAAADRHGRTVVVLYHMVDDSWYICTPIIIMPQPLLSQRRKRMIMQRPQREEDDSPPLPPLLQTILRRENNGHYNNNNAAAAPAASLLYLVATGVAGDAQYLVSELQRYGVMIKHRFGTTMQNNNWEQRIIPYLLRRCFNYDERNAWNLPVIDEYYYDDEDNNSKKFPYSRPLGLRAVLCRYDETNRRWHLSSMDPSGTLSVIEYNKNHDCTCFVMGQDSKTIQEQLQSLHSKAKQGEKYNRDEQHDPSSSSAAAAAIETLLRTALEGRSLQLEILRPDGSLEQRTIAAADSAAR
jgi:hypothetical protein